MKNYLKLNKLFWHCRKYPKDKDAKRKLEKLQRSMGQ